MAAISQATFICNLINEKFCIFNRISLKIVPKGSIDNESVLVRGLTWRRIGDKPLPGLMLTHFTDAYMRHWGRWVKYLAYFYTKTYLKQRHIFWTQEHKSQNANINIDFFIQNPYLYKLYSPIHNPIINQALWNINCFIVIFICNCLIRSPRPPSAYAFKWIS